MKWLTLSLILLSVSLGAIAQILLKTGLPLRTSLNTDGGLIAETLRMLWNPWVIAGLGLYASSAIVWLFVLSRTEVSYAYPFVSLGFILTVTLGAVLLGEQVGPSRIIGTLLIVIGIFFIARS